MKVAASLRFGPSWFVFANIELICKSEAIPTGTLQSRLTTTCDYTTFD